VRERGKPFIDKWAVFHFFTALEIILAYANAEEEGKSALGNSG